jgi:hypothetical protein
MRERFGNVQTLHSFWFFQLSSFMQGSIPYLVSESRGSRLDRNPRSGAWHALLALAPQELARDPVGFGA